VAVQNLSDEIWAVTEARVASYLGQRDEWNAIGALKRLLDQTVRDYEHRALYELLQNAHDAHPKKTTSGRVLVHLVEDEGEYGTLYVANTGRPFEPANFEAITGVAQSDKKPDEGIGNKGIGFKSVLQLCDVPEVYSTSPSGGYDGGYCFRFATIDDVARTGAVASDFGLAGEVMNDVPHLCLPVPLDGVTSTVDQLLRGPYVTVVRLPLRSASTLVDAVEQVRTVASGPPPLLFLDRLVELQLRVTGGESPLELELGRHEEPLFESLDVRVVEVTLDQNRRFLLSERVVDSGAFVEHIERSVEEGKLSKSWSEWSGDATVAVAVPRSGPPLKGRMYTFLPMGDRAISPVAAHVNAPFFARLARVDLEESVPLNDFLLDEIAVACAQTLLASAAGRVDLRPSEVCDFLSWSGSPGRLSRAFNVVETPLREAEIVPAIGKQRWASLGNIYALDDAGREVVVRSALAKAAGVAFVDPELDGERASMLDGLAKSVAQRSLVPPKAELAGWVEALAAELSRKRFRPELWGKFYDELRGLFTDASSLAGRRILLDDDGKVRPCADPRGDARKAVPFFPPRADGGDSQDDDDGSDLKLPSRLRSRLFFINHRIPWRIREGKTWKNRPGRAFLEEGLVNEYRASELFAVVARAVTGVGKPAQSEELLRWVMRFYETKSEPPWNDLGQVPLRVPTAEGRWILATEALFGREWGAAASVDQLLADLIEEASPNSNEIAALRSRLIPAPAKWPFRIADVAFAREFLERIGVRHGLWPEAISGTDRPFEGRFLQQGDVGSLLPTTDRDRETWLRAQLFQAGRALRGFTQYRPRSAHVRIPGQQDHDEMTDEAKRAYACLVVDGLGLWPAETFEVEYRRYNDVTDRITISTPAAAFLRFGAWMPVSDPSDRRTWRFVECASAWTHSETREAAPQYLTLVPHQIRGLVPASGLTGSRLRGFGVRYWDDAATATDRIRELTDMISSALLPESGISAARRDYEEAWDEAVQSLNPFPAGIPSLLATRGGVLSAWCPGDGTVYVEDEDGTPLLGILEKLGKPVFRIRRGRTAQVADYLCANLSEAQRFSTTSIEVDLLGEGAAPVVREPLLDPENPWLLQLVIVILDTWRGPFQRPPSSAEIELAAARLRSAEVATAASFELRLDSETIDNVAAGLRAFVLSDADPPSIVTTTTDAATAEGRYERLATQIAELAGFPFIADSLRLRLIDLSRRGFDDKNPPDLTAIAEVVGESPDAIRQLWIGANSEASNLLRFLCPLAAVTDIDAARTAWESRESYSDAETVHRWFTEVRGHTVDPGMIEAARTGGLVQPLLSRLGLRPKEINRAVGELGPPFQPLLPATELEQQFRSWKQRNRRQVTDSIRQTFLETYRSGGDLSRYLLLIDLSALQADPAWADDFVELSDDVAAGHVRRWFASNGCKDSALVSDMEDLDSLRLANRALLASLLPRIEVVVAAWHSHHGRETTAEEAMSLDVDAMISTGRLDFDRLDVPGLINSLALSGRWPTDMPTTLDLDVLGITEDDVAALATEEDRARQEAEVRRRQIGFGDQQVTVDETNYSAIAQLVRERVSRQLLDVPPREVHLETLASSTKESRRGDGRPGTTAGKQPRLSQTQISGIGLIGEVIALEWLKTQYSDLTDDAWKSGYRNMVLGDGGGDDTLGYDFEVHHGKLRLLCEVKATVGDDTEFTLTPAEMACAQQLRRNERYRVIFIQRALEPDAFRIRVLPNPMSPQYRQQYRFAGEGVRLRFVPSEADGVVQTLDI